VSEKASWWFDYLLYRLFRFLFQRPRRILKGYVKPRNTVLDAGCGTGYFSLAMARMVGEEGTVVCVDTKAERIESLRQRAKAVGLSKCIETRTCKDRGLEIADLDGKIDFALAVYVVHHAADPLRLMEEIYKALKPEGLFYVIEPRHHASLEERRITEAAGQEAGFSVSHHPKLFRDWGVVFLKS
jgi:ubiquinone/menaquinone biosynthesis C-methylase UbiE